MIDTIFNYANIFFQQYTILAVAIILVLLFAAYHKPKESFKLAIFVLIIFCVIYAIDMFGESADLGSKHKQEAIHKTKKVVD